jgi:hypothetical protein
MQTGTGSIEEFQDWLLSTDLRVYQGSSMRTASLFSILKNLASERDVDVSCSACLTEFSGDERKPESISVVCCYSRNPKWKNVNVCLFFPPNKLYYFFVTEIRLIFTRF